jgi:hypothetical protein
MKKQADRLGAVVALLGATTVFVPAVDAQSSVDDVAVYHAVMRTPIGAVTPVVTSTMIGTLQNGASLALRYGYLPTGTLNGTFNNLAITGILPAGLGSTVSVTGGISTESCDAGCGAKLMLGAAGDIRLMSKVFGTTPRSSRMTVALSGEFGYAQTAGGHVMSGHVGAPISLVPPNVQGAGMQFVPFVTPGFAFGQLSDASLSAGESGTKYTVGGGVGIINRESSVSVHVGFQYIGVTNAKTMFGLGIQVGGK